MKVLHINMGKHLGGIEVFLRNLALYSKDINYIIVCRANSLFDQDIAVYVKHLAHIQLLPITLNSSPLSYMLFMIKLIKLILSNNIKLIHAHGVFAHLYAVIAKLILLCSIKVIVTIHSNSRYDRDSKWKNSFVHFLERTCLIFTDRIVTISNYLKNLLQGNRTMKRVRTIYNGVPAPTNIIISENDNSHFTVSSFGRLETIKGHKYLIEAIAIVKNRIPKIQCNIIGDGEERTFLQQLTTSLDLDHNVNFLGYQRNIEPFVNTSDLIVLPSVMEGLSLSAIEAIMYKKPLIASNIGGIPEVIEHGHSGVLVNPKDHLAIANAILALYNDPVLARSYSEAGYKRYLERFSIESMVNAYYDIYAELL